MDETFGSRLKHAWNAFMNRDPTVGFHEAGYAYRPDRKRVSGYNERTIVNSIYNRIAMDVAAIKIQHIQLDDGGRFLSVKDSALNSCLNLNANADQTGRDFIQDVAMSMLDEGCVAILPVDTDFNPNATDSYKINSLRTGKILEWYPQHIRVRVFNEATGKKEEINVPKRIAAIVENPFYAVMNEPNSTMQRLVRKLNLLDAIDEQSSSGKLDLIIQLPYIIKTDARRQQAEKRRKDIEDQLAGKQKTVALEMIVEAGA